MTVSDEQNARAEPSQKAVVEDKIMDWLETQGTILELTVASKFQKHLGFNSYARNVSHGRLYRTKDPITAEDKFREIDVVVRTTPITNVNQSLSIWLIFECKSRIKHPWIFYRSSESTNFGTKYEDAFLVLSNTKFDSKAIGGLHDVSLFNIERAPFSTGGVAALTKDFQEPTDSSRNSSTNDSRNGVREAILQVLSATEGVSKEIGLVSEGLIAAILVPIVVTKAPMFAVTLDELGTPKLERIYRELVVTRSKLDDGKLKYVWVIHESQIDKLAKEFASALSYIYLNL